MRAVCHPCAQGPDRPPPACASGTMVAMAHEHPSPRASSAAAHLRAILGGLLLLAALWLIPDPSLVRPGVEAVALVHGRVLSIAAADPETGLQTARVEILDGERAGEEVTADLGTGAAVGPGGPVAPEDVAPAYAPGDDVVLQVSTTPDGEFIAVSDLWRVPLLVSVVLLFAVLVVIVAGWRGARALVALAITVAVVLKVLLPLLVLGWDPVLLAVVTGSVVTLVTLLLTEGPRRSTAAAAIGTFTALLATALIAAVVTTAARFTVLQGSEDVGFLQGMIGIDVELGGLLLASIILGALGVLDDVTVTQAMTVEELARADPGASRSALAGRAMNVGRAHIGATVNTLVLAYVAAALPLLLLFALSAQPVGALASTEVVAVEIVRAVVGSMGIVLAVPFTTFVAARLVGRGKPGRMVAPGPVRARARPWDRRPWHADGPAAGPGRPRVTLLPAHPPEP